MNVLLGRMFKKFIDWQESYKYCINLQQSTKKYICWTSLAKFSQDMHLRSTRFEKQQIYGKTNVMP